MSALGGALLGLALCMAPASPSRADIYKYIDENGVVHLSGKRLGDDWQLILRGRVPARSRPARDFESNRRRYSQMIDRVARLFRLDKALVHAVVRAESAYDAHAVSPKGAVGLMQLMPATARRYGVRDRYNPAQNVYAGVRYLRDLLFQFNDVVLALAAYNAGEQAVRDNGYRMPPYPETQTYVRRVLTYYHKLRSAS